MPSPEEVEQQRKAALAAAGINPVVEAPLVMDFTQAQPGQVPQAPDLTRPTLQSTGEQRASASTAFDPSGAQAVEAAAPAAAPAVNPDTPEYTQEQYAALIRQEAAGQGPRMTAGNRRAARDLELLNVGDEERMRAIGDLHEQKGVEDQRTRREISTDIALANQSADELDQQENKRQADQQARLEKVSGTMDDLQKEIAADGKNLDPNRLMGQPGRRIAFTIAAFLGGFGSGILGKQSRIPDMIEAALDRDYKGQLGRLNVKKENLGKMDDVYNRLRQAGMDAGAAAAGRKAIVFETLGRNIEGRLQNLQGDKARADGEILKNEFYMKADEWRKIGLAMAARPSGKAPISEAEVLRRAQALEMGQHKLAAGEIANQGAVAKANQPGGPEGDRAADLKRQSDLASQVANTEQAIAHLNEMEQLITSGAVGTGGAHFPGLQGTEKGRADANRFNQLQESAVTSEAASRGGPITTSDMESSEKVVGAISGSILDSTMLAKVRNAKKLMEARKVAILRGQRGSDVRQIEQNRAERPDLAPPTQPESTDQLRSRFNAR